MIRKAIGSIVIYGAVMYMIVMLGPKFDFTPYIIYPAQSLKTLSVFFLVWWVLWFVYVILRRILKILAMPLGWVSFGLSNTIINLWALYIIPVILNTYQSTFVVTVGSFLELLILSALLAIVWIVTKYF